ncbi:MAG: bacteriohopanetetrol glucosamine biosynthesis glycosyltransferase HpnI [Bryobacteraceae bacterium]
MLVLVLAALVTGSAVFCVLVIVAARRFPKAADGSSGAAIGISVLKPLAGVDAGLEENLRAVFTQRYAEFEILFAVREAGDEAVAVVKRLMAAYPAIPARLIVTGEPPYANAKVYSLEQMTAAARYGLLAMCDSDIRVEPDFLERMAAEFADEGLGVTTCPYRAVPGDSIWSRLEAMMMNTEFLSGILVARMLEGMRFAVGPTIVARKKAIAAIGGWERLRDYLAEDFMLGQLAAANGAGVGLSPTIVEHHIAGSGTESFAANAEHRLRWARSTRRSRPAGYVGQVFTNPAPWALALAVAAFPEGLLLAGAAMTLRAAAAWAVAGGILRDPLCKRYWYMVPVADLVTFGFWIAGFFGNSIRWRGRQYRLGRDGRFARIV